MYCGGCFRDNALAGALRQMGHDLLLLPLYLPLTLEEPDNSAGAPLFFSGINVYLEQKSAFFRHAPHWLNRLLAAPALLRWAGRMAAKTRPTETGALTISMIRGEAGNQARELAELISWLKANTSPAVICLSNALLVGLARRIKAELKVPVVCTLQGEDGFLDALPEAFRAEAWRILSERAADVDLFLAPSHYFGSVMQQRLGLSPDRVRVVHNGINLEGFAPAPALPDPPVWGFFARLCPEKGLDRVVDAFLILKQRNRVPGLKLRLGGSLGPADKPWVAQLHRRLVHGDLAQQFEVSPNLDRAGKQAFYRSLSVLSVPTVYGEAFGLYLLEAWATGIPVVQPQRGAFPELVNLTGGGVVYDPAGGAEALANSVETLLLHPNQARTMGEAGRKSVLERFSIQAMANQMVQELRTVVAEHPGQNQFDHSPPLSSATR